MLQYQKTLPGWYQNNSPMIVLRMFVKFYYDVSKLKKMASYNVQSVEMNVRYITSSQRQREQEGMAAFFLLKPKKYPYNDSRKTVAHTLQGL